MQRKWKLKHALAALLSSGTLVTAAQAQAPDIRLLGYNSTLTASCNIGCTQLTLAFALAGLQSTDNIGQPVPAPLSALTGFIRNATVQVFGTNPTITGFSGASASYTSTIDNGPPNFAALVLTNQTLPLTGNSLALVLNLAPGSGMQMVSVSGLAYLDPNLSYLNASGAIVPVPPPLPPPPGGPFYQTADFNVSLAPVPIITNSVPEPSSYALLAVGLVGLGAAAARRRRA